MDTTPFRTFFYQVHVLKHLRKGNVIGIIHQLKSIQHVMYLQNYSKSCISAAVKQLAFNISSPLYGVFSWVSVYEKPIISLSISIICISLP